MKNIRASIRKAMAESLQAFVDKGIKTSFTKSELDLLGVIVPEIQFTPQQIKAIRDKLHSG
jgi:hypothetical protein